MNRVIFLGCAYSTIAFAAGGSFSVDLKHATSSEVSFDGTGKPSLLHIHGTSSAAPTGTVTFTDRQLGGTAEFDLRTLDTGIEVRNEHMKTKYLQTGKFPLAKLEFTQTVLPDAFAPGRHYEDLPFHAMLTVHGKTKPVSGKITVAGDKKNVSLQATFALRIADYEIPRPGYAGISMADDVVAHVSLSAPLAH